LRKFNGEIHVCARIIFFVGKLELSVVRDCTFLPLTFLTQDHDFTDVSKRLQREIQAYVCWRIHVRLYAVCTETVHHNID